LILSYCYVYQLCVGIIRTLREEGKGEREAQALEVMMELGPGQVGCGWIRPDLVGRISLDSSGSVWISLDLVGGGWPWLAGFLQVWTAVVWSPPGEDQRLSRDKLSRDRLLAAVGSWPWLAMVGELSRGFRDFRDIDQEPSACDHRFLRQRKIFKAQ
jgi:hypothetical protein